VDAVGAYRYAATGFAAALAAYQEAVNRLPNTFVGSTNYIGIVQAASWPMAEAGGQLQEGAGADGARFRATSGWLNDMGNEFYYYLRRSTIGYRRA